MSNVVEEYTNIASKLVAENANKEMRFKPLDKVRVIKLNDSRFGKVFTIERVNHYNGRYYFDLTSYTEDELELVTKHNWVESYGKQRKTKR